MKICNTIAEAQAVKDVVRVHFNAQGKPVAYTKNDALPAELTRVPDTNAERTEALKAEITPFMVAEWLINKAGRLDEVMKGIAAIKKN